MSGYVTLCMLAVGWCQRTDFREWSNTKTEAEARDFILKKCHIKSRRELDTNKKAAQLFHELIRIPFNSRLSPANGR